MIFWCILCKPGQEDENFFGDFWNFQHLLIKNDIRQSWTEYLAEKNFKKKNCQPPLPPSTMLFFFSWIEKCSWTSQNSHPRVCISPQSIQKMSIQQCKQQHCKWGEGHVIVTWKDNGDQKGSTMQWNPCKMPNEAFAKLFWPKLSEPDGYVWVIQLKDEKANLKIS